MGALRYDNRVVIITGAGNGLGRTHALQFAQRGAKVVVNDLGGGIAGEGRGSEAADAVVAEIRAAGGEAIANYDSVEEGDKIVAAALAAYGGLDVLVNNAGILRDVSFQKMQPADWDLVYRVHLLGSMRVTQAAWNVMRQKGYGRILMTTSAAGVYGNFGQANYSAAKLGIVGLANTLAEEGRARNIHVNTIAPIAASRLTQSVLPPELHEALGPEYVSPLVVWLCHESCRETKALYEVGGGYHAKLRIERSRGVVLERGAFSAEDLQLCTAALDDFSVSDHPTSSVDSLRPLLAGAGRKRSASRAAPLIDLKEASAQTLTLTSSYYERDVALYALGVGAAQDAQDPKELAFVYESAPLQVLPTYAVIPQLTAMLRVATPDSVGLPGMNFGFDRVLHGEQMTLLHGPLPVRARLTHSFRFKAAYDKSPHAVVVFAITSKDESGIEVAYNETTMFVRDGGGWGGDSGPSSAGAEPLPEREPDVVREERIATHQSLLYRLSGDWNPLHVDPAFARQFGFSRPILHGLCTYGYAGRHLLREFLDNEPARFKSIRVRFAEPVFPGETLVTRMWQASALRVVFETRVKERNMLVLKNGVAEFYAISPRRTP